MFATQPSIREDCEPFTSTQSFHNLSCAHRQWRHDGACKVLHGYGRSFTFVFGAITMDKCGFVVDFGELTWLKTWLEYQFDHTLLLCRDDPYLEQFQQLEQAGVCNLRVVENTSTEALAKLACERADVELRERTKGRCWVVCVEARENDKNSAVYVNPGAGFRGWL